MTDRPILLGAPMIRAMLDGWRIIGELPGHEFDDALSIRDAVGDRLWAREAWRATNTFDVGYAPRDIPNHNTIFYEVKPPQPGHDLVGTLRAGTHKPRWTSHLKLGVTGVKVERLQDISEADARAEGVESRVPMGRVDLNYAWRQRFRELWLSINGPGSWEANPWVCAVSFTVERRNIDARP